MTSLLKLSSRQWLIVLHDLLVTGAALAAALLIRFEDEQITQRLNWLAQWVPAFIVLAGLIYFYFRLHEAKWRFTSLSVLLTIVRASIVLALCLLLFDYILLSPDYFGTFYFGKVTVALYCLLQMAFLAGPRIAYRHFRDVRTQMHVRDATSSPALVLARASDADMSLRAIESGFVRKLRPVGILSPSRSDWGTTIRGVPVLGGFDDLGQVIDVLRKQDISITRLLLTPSAFEPSAGTESILMQARRLGIATSRLPSIEEGGEALRLAPVVVEDLLLRPSVKIDYRRLEAVVKGKAITVTGGGGSIGAEICDRVATFGATRILVVENSEPALYAVLQALNAKQPAMHVEGRLADVRDRERMFRLFAEFKPDIVFHAAALKHVPLLEQDWGEGVKTNIFGTVNVADAAVAAGASSMVMISTDKAIEPVSVLGATKRLAEMYCQAIDAERTASANGGRTPTRLISVRFGNVLASNGSVVPKFKAQIEAGGPVTVTHPDMVRYFMTIQEACDLVLNAAGHALGPGRSDASIYVLNMGQPVRILDLAERLIRLSGLEPGRDIEIAYTGIRPGERLTERLFTQDETNIEVGIPGVVAAKPSHPSQMELRVWLAQLSDGVTRHDSAAVGQILREAVPDYQRPQSQQN